MLSGINGFEEYIELLEFLNRLQDDNCWSTARIQSIGAQLAAHPVEFESV